MYLDSSHSIRTQNSNVTLLEIAARLWRRLRRSVLVCKLRKAAGDHAPVAQALADGFIVAMCFWISFLIRFSGSLPISATIQYGLWVPVVVLLRLLSNRTTGIYRFIWQFVCLRDVLAIIGSFLTATAGLVLLRFCFSAAHWSPKLEFPLTVLALEFFFSLSVCLGARVASRLIHERRHRAHLNLTQPVKRILLYGAGRAGMLLARELANDAGIEVAGFVDDDPEKVGTVISGIRVLGTGESLENLVRWRSVEQVVISIAAADSKALARILARCKKIPVNTQIVPSVEEIVSQRVKISRVRGVRIEDLLGRNSVSVGDFDRTILRAYRGKRILVTGAGGSIGSELCRQLMLLDPCDLSILDKDENSIYELEQELKQRYAKPPIHPLIADVKIRERILALFDEFRPDVVFHAAAHKHVPLMEHHPCEAVLNNVLGTMNVLDACHSCGAERLMFISTDKAVNPTSIMGATKKIGEMLVQMQSREGRPRGSCVRFGNVLGSRGSVIPLFQRQIDQGGPVTVTHPNIVRYFMTILEAVQLVLLAGSAAKGGEVFVLDMGTPRKILDLASQMVELSGLEVGKDIEISITGLRPGEKMNEELAAPNELLNPTRFEKISQIGGTWFDEKAFSEHVASLIKLAQANDRAGLYKLLGSMGIGFTHLPSGTIGFPQAAESDLNLHVA